MSTYTVVYGTLDLLPQDGPGIYNRDPVDGCTHEIGKRWVIWDGDCLTPKGKIAAPRATICLDCGCGVPELGKKPRPVPTRDECEKLMHAEFLGHWYAKDMSPSTIVRTLRYLFGVRAFPRPANIYRGKSFTPRATARLRNQPRQTHSALSAARSYRAEQRIKGFPKDMRRLGTAFAGYTRAACDGVRYPVRWPSWMRKGGVAA